MCAVDTDCVIRQTVPVRVSLVTFLVTAEVTLALEATVQLVMFSGQEVFDLFFYFVLTSNQGYAHVRFKDITSDN